MDIKTLALYLGCQAQLNFSDEPDAYEVTIDCAALKRLEDFPDETSLRPILRPLSSMTEDEKKIKYLHMKSKEAWIGKEDKEETLESFMWMLSKGFDLFGLIKKGEAISTEETH